MKKTTFTLFVYLILCNVIQAQDLISPKAFDKLIIQDITYTIFGDSNPIPGIKVDISKPEASINGILPLNTEKSILLGFDFKGGITDKNFSIFKGYTSFNTAFEFKPSFYFIPSSSSASYPPIETHKFELDVTRADIDKSTMEIRTKSEDDYIAANLIYNQYFKCVKSEKCDNITIPSLTTNQKTALIRIIKEDLKITDEKLNINNETSLILSSIPIAEMTENGKINLNTYNKDVSTIYDGYKKKYEDRNENTWKKEIEIASRIWTQKNYFWVTISPFARTEKVNLFHTKKDGVDSLYFKNNHPFYYGLNGSANWLIVVPNKIAHYFKAGINLSRANNIASLDSFTYNSTTPFFNSGQTITEKVKTGVAYNESDLKNGFLGQVVGEYYLLPLKNLIPGVYISGNLNLSNLYKLNNIVGRENDNILFGAEGGLVFNINDRNNDKSLISICLYSRFADLTDKRRTNKTTNILESKDDFRERNLSFGIKIGIPISLPKKSN